MHKVARWDWFLFSMIVLGIVASVTVPIMWQTVRIYWPKPPEKGVAPIIVRWWPIVRPFVALGAASLVTAPIIYALAGDSFDGKWQLALLAGYAWDSTLQKVATK